MCASGRSVRDFPRPGNASAVGRAERAWWLLNSRKHARLRFARQDTSWSIPCFSLASGDFAGGFLEEFVDQSLVGLGLSGGHTAKLAEEFWGEEKIGSGE